MINAVDVAAVRGAIRRREQLGDGAIDRRLQGGGSGRVAEQRATEEEERQILHVRISTPA